LRSRRGNAFRSFPPIQFRSPISPCHAILASRAWAFSRQPIGFQIPHPDHLPVPEHPYCLGVARAWRRDLDHARFNGLFCRCGNRHRRGRSRSWRRLDDRQHHEPAGAEAGTEQGGAAWLDRAIGFDQGSAGAGALHGRNSSFFQRSGCRLDGGTECPVRAQRTERFICASRSRAHASSRSASSRSESSRSNGIERSSCCGTRPRKIRCFQNCGNFAARNFEARNFEDLGHFEILRGFQTLGIVDSKTVFIRNAAHGRSRSAGCSR
jgi:hypothetical protein